MVTLEKDGANSEVVGVAYRVHEQDVEEVLDELDFREKGGYSRNIVLVKLQDDKGNNTGETVESLLYTGTEDNPNYADPSIRENNSVMSEIIYRSVGPSGPNRDYLFNLAEFVRSVNLIDDHVFDLEERVKKLEETSNPQGNVENDDAQAK